MLMIIQKSKTKLRQPVVLCSWPGIGMVGRYVVNHLVHELQANTYAEVDLQEYMVIKNVVVENGIIYTPTYVKEKIYYTRWQDTDFLLFYSDFIPSENNMLKLAHDFLNFLQCLDIQYLITFAGVPSNILHTDTPKVYLAATHNVKNLSNMVKPALEKLSSGVIEGMNGVVLSLLRDYDIEGYCFVVEVPFYTIDMYNPQSAKVVLNIIEQIFKFQLDYNKVLQDIKLLDEHLRTIFSDVNEKVKQLLSQMERRRGSGKGKKEMFSIIDDYVSYNLDNGITFEELKKRLKFSLPESAKKKINELFKLAAENIEYAKQLKEELDRWGVYKEYEDKFLSLFLKNKQKGKGNEE